MRDLASELQAAGEMGLERYLMDQNDDDFFGGPCDCLTCIVREVLHGVWPIIEPAMRMFASHQDSNPTAD